MLRSVVNKHAGIGLLLLSGLSLVGAFPPFDQGWLIWVGLIPALLAIRIRPGVQKRPFASGYLVGVVYFGGVFWWIGHVTALGTSALVLYLALYPAIWFWAMERLVTPRCPTRVITNMAYATAGASLWVALEWCRGWLLTGFGWNNLGVALHANIPLIQLASLGGVYLLSWLVVFVNLAAFRMGLRVVEDILARHKRGPFYELSFALVLVASGFAWGFHRTLVAPPADKTLRYACVQANIPQFEGQDDPLPPMEKLHRHEEWTNLAVASKPQLLIWPESTTNLGIFIDPRFNALVTRITRGHDYYFLLGASDFEAEKIFNGAFFFYPNWSGSQTYHKNKLVIFGEYVPLARQLPILRKLVPYGIDFTPGNKPAKFKMPDLGISLSPLICFEDTLPTFVRTATEQNPDILVNITNDSWFKTSPGAQQHLNNALFRTVENDRPLIRCANTGITCEINQYGIVRAQLSENGRSVCAAGVLTRELRWHKPSTTLYQRLGDWVPLLSSIVFLWIICPSFNRLLNKGPKE
jgi:apolipoprotein N-acyltransferase